MQFRSVTRGNVTSFFLESESAERVEVDAPAEVFACAGHATRAATDDPDSAADAARVLRELDVEVGADERGSIFVLALVVGARALAIGKVHKAGGYRGSETDRLTAAVVTNETPEECLDRHRKEWRSHVRLIAMGVVALTAALSCAVLEVVRPGGRWW
jgi:hypothetical protein